MRDAIRPFVPAIFCAILSLITMSANLAVAFVNGSAPQVGSGDVVFLSFLPMCFYIAGTFVAKLQQENQELRNRLDQLTAERNSAAAGSFRTRERQEPG